MKVERINENKIKITLSMNELEERNISLKDIEKDSSKAKNIFLDLIAESNLENSFAIDHSQLFVEATTDYNDFFTITITKMDELLDISKFSLLDQFIEKKLLDKKGNLPKKVINSNIESYSNVFLFDSIDKVLDMCDMLKFNKCFYGKSSLYLLKGKYFLIFSKHSDKNIKFKKTYSIINEYSDNSFLSELYEISLKEKSKSIIISNAIQVLVKI